MECDWTQQLEQGAFIVLCSPCGPCATLSLKRGRRLMLFLTPPVVNASPLHTKPLHPSAFVSLTLYNTHTLTHTHAALAFSIV